MFNLVSKRYLFLIISLIVIVPGVISLIFKGFDVGIDFVGGSSLEFRPSTTANLTNTQKITDLLDQLGLKDVQVNIGNDTSVPARRVAWVRLNTNIDSNAETTIKNDLLGNKQISGSSVTFDPLQLTGKDGKTTTVTVVTIASKTTNITASDINTALKVDSKGNIPSLKTTIPSQSSSSSSSPTSPAVTPTAQATAAATATATPAATATTTPSSTPTATPTSTSSSSSSGTIQVSVAGI